MARGPDRNIIIISFSYIKFWQHALIMDFTWRCWGAGRSLS